jgi:hypothetical protein
MTSLSIGCRTSHRLPTDRYQALFEGASPTLDSICIFPHDLLLQSKPATVVWESQESKMAQMEDFIVQLQRNNSTKPRAFRGLFKQ